MQQAGADEDEGRAPTKTRSFSLASRFKAWRAKEDNSAERSTADMPSSFVTPQAPPRLFARLKERFSAANPATLLPNPAQMVASSVISPTVQEEERGAIKNRTRQRASTGAPQIPTTQQQQQLANNKEFDSDDAQQDQPLARHSTTPGLSKKRSVGFNLPPSYSPLSTSSSVEISQPHGHVHTSDPERTLRRPPRASKSEHSILTHRASEPVPFTRQDRASEPGSQGSHSRPFSSQTYAGPPSSLRGRKSVAQVIRESRAVRESEDATQKDSSAPGSFQRLGSLKRSGSLNRGAQRAKGFKFGTDNAAETITDILSSKERIDIGKVYGPFGSTYERVQPKFSVEFGSPSGALLPTPRLTQPRAPTAPRSVDDVTSFSTPPSTQQQQHTTALDPSSVLHSPFHWRSLPAPKPSSVGGIMQPSFPLRPSDQYKQEQQLLQSQASLRRRQSEGPSDSRAKRAPPRRNLTFGGDTENSAM